MSRDRRKRPGSSTAAVKASAVSWPTPGMLISLRQVSDALTIRLMSPSIATTAASTAARAATRPRMAADRPGMPSLAPSACLMKAGLSARGSRTPNTTARPRIWFSLTYQLLASDDQRPDSVRRQRLHMNGLEEAGAGEMRQATCVVAVGLVRRQRLQRLIRLPALDADDGQPKFG